MVSLAQWLKQQILRRYSSNYSHPGRKGMHREALKSKNASVQGGQGSCTRWEGCFLETQLCWPQAPDWNSSSTFGIYKTPSSWDMEAYCNTLSVLWTISWLCRTEAHGLQERPLEESGQKVVSCLLGSALGTRHQSRRILGRIERLTRPQKLMFCQTGR